MEEYAAKKAAERRTKEDLAEMAAIMEKMEQCTDVDEFVDLDNDFHLMIINTARSKSLKRAWEGLQFGEWTYATVLATSHSIKELYESHVQLFECIKNGADHTAGACMFLHIKGFSDEMLEYIRSENASETPSDEDGE